VDAGESDPRSTPGSGIGPPIDVQWEIALDLDRHGFSVLDLTPTRAQMDWYAISDRADPQAKAAHTASWYVEAGTQRVRPATSPI
jgi:hypothetical protein